MQIDEVIAEITQRCRNYGAQKIILFGSRAKGTATERSDIDIAVSGVASSDILNWRKLWKIFQHCIQLILLILIPVKISYCWRTLNNTDEKFIRRFESFQNSLDLLAEARERDLSDSFVLSGTSAKFSITFDLAWKVMKDILVQYYAITGFVTGSPRSTETVFSGRS